MEEIDEIIALLKSGQWHTLEDIICGSKLRRAKANKILQFLTDFNFIIIDRQNEKAKITPILLKFLNKNHAC